MEEWLVGCGGEDETSFGGRGGDEGSGMRGGDGDVEGG
jgi:hypothetical protein